MILQLIRLVPDPKRVQIGVLLDDTGPIVLTLEPPLVEAQYLAIPAGKYSCKRVFDRVTHGGSIIKTTFEVMVPGRTGILFHIGNSIVDTRGCILPGVEIGENLILKSRIGFNKFLARTQDISEFSLEVQNGRR